MGEGDVKIFEKVTIDFLNENLPERYTVTIVEVRDQKLLTGNVRRTLRELQTSSSLEVDMYIEGGGTPSANIFRDEIDTVFEEKKDTFEDNLADASTLFSRMFDPNPFTSPENTNGTESNDGEVFLAAGSFLLGLAIVVIGALFVRYRQVRNKALQPQLDILSWTTGSQKDESDNSGPEIVLMDSVGESDSGPDIDQYYGSSMELKPLGQLALSPNSTSSLRNASGSIEMSDLSLPNYQGSEKDKHDAISIDSIDILPPPVVKSPDSSDNGQRLCSDNMFCSLGN